MVAGDTRFDRVAEIARAARKIDVVERFKGDKRLFVAGSTWGPDEELLIRLMNDNPDVKFLIAPHEMEEGRIARLMEQTRGGALRYTACTPSTGYGSKQLLILDTVGLLSSVYGYAAWGYIGGGFGVGIHNTLEAATFRPAHRVRPQLPEIQGSPRPGDAERRLPRRKLRPAARVVHPSARQPRLPAENQPYRPRLHHQPPRRHGPDSPHDFPVNVRFSHKKVSSVARKRLFFCFSVSLSTCWS